MKAFVSKHISSILSAKAGINTIPLQEYLRLDKPVNTHADMLVLVIDDHIFCYEEYFNQNKELFKEIEEKYKIIKITKCCSKDYPNDIGLNVLIMGRIAFANLKHTCPEVLEYLSEKEYELVNVKQGYSACSTLVLDENNAISADKGICTSIEKSGKKSLLISEQGIVLKGYNHGFIGGASCVIDKTVYFFGDIKNHPDYQKIHEFIEACEMKEKSILRGDVVDFGGARVF